MRDDHLWWLRANPMIPVMTADSLLLKRSAVAVTIVSFASVDDVGMKDFSEVYFF